MVFSSFNFILIFLPLFIISYYMIDDKYRNLCIFMYSIAFYAYGCMENPHYVVILILSLFMNYHLARIIEKHNVFSKVVFVVSVLFNISILFVFKYFDFFGDIISYFNSGVNIKKLNLVLPIGISFYTFQVLSYLIDVHSQKIHALDSFINLSTYIIMFPQLIAGPILRYDNIRYYIENKKQLSYKKFFEGLRIFTIGLASKVIIANQLSAVQLDVGIYDQQLLSFATTWLCSICYIMQLYFDFYGYSIMAIGLGKMMGFEIVENFNEPFKSLTVREFWNRWHITLSHWFKDYIFYPIYRSKIMDGFKKKLTKIFNVDVARFIAYIISIFVVWLFTGLWHGANVNFVIWGMFFFVLMVIENIFLNKVIDKFKIIGHVYLIIAVVVAFTIFSNEDLSILIIKLRNMFLLNKVDLIDDNFITILNNNLKAVIFSLFFVIGIPQYLYHKLKPIKLINIIIIISLFATSIWLIYSGNNDPFMYFRF